jgi:hypothetical protein
MFCAAPVHESYTEMTETAMATTDVTVQHPCFVLQQSTICILGKILDQLFKQIKHDYPLGSVSLNKPENKRQNDKQNKNAYLMISSHNTE